MLAPDELSFGVWPGCPLPPPLIERSYIILIVPLSSYGRYSIIGMYFSSMVQKESQTLAHYCSIYVSLFFTLKERR